MRLRYKQQSHTPITRAVEKPARIDHGDAAQEDELVRAALVRLASVRAQATPTTMMSRATAPDPGGVDYFRLLQEKALPPAFALLGAALAGPPGAVAAGGAAELWQAMKQSSDESRLKAALRAAEEEAAQLRAENERLLVAHRNQQLRAAGLGKPPLGAFASATPAIMSSADVPRPREADIAARIAEMRQNLARPEPQPSASSDVAAAIARMVERQRAQMKAVDHEVAPPNTVAQADLDERLRAWQAKLRSDLTGRRAVASQLGLPASRDSERQQRAARFGATSHAAERGPQDDAFASHAHWMEEAHDEVEV